MCSDIYHHYPIFTPRFQIFAIYLQVANLYKSIFFRPVTEIMERLTGMNDSYLKLITNMEFLYITVILIYFNQKYIYLKYIYLLF